MTSMRRLENSLEHRKVLLLELNEINWGVVDKLVASHGADYLPNFKRLRSQGSFTTQTALERAPHLDPWVTWVTLHTGVPREVHGASVLEQSASTINAPRTWEYVSAAGKKVGIFGSIGSYPPKPVNGFMVPGPFAPGPETFPSSLEPIQRLNRLGTQEQNKTGVVLRPAELAGLTMRLLGQGLKPKTVMAVAAQLLREKMKAPMRWRRPALQPLINYDIFSHLYRRLRPDFATWHTNHAAHFMHHYWRAWDDSGFRAKATALERKLYGDAVPFGYRLCDALIGRFLGIIDERTVLVVASSMGQMPYQSDRYQDGKIIVRIRSMNRFLQIVGNEGIEDVVPTMVPQWNVTIRDPQRKAEVKRRLQAVRRQVGDRSEPAIFVEETGELLTITPLGLPEKADGIRVFFDGCPDAPREGYAMEALFAVDAPTAKQGMHHPEGILAFIGAGIAKGQQLRPCSSLDVAPTILSLLGIPVPPLMHGRPLIEASDSDFSPRPSATAPLRPAVVNVN